MTLVDQLVEQIANEIDVEILSDLHALVQAIYVYSIPDDVCSGDLISLLSHHFLEKESAVYLGRGNDNVHYIFMQAKTSTLIANEHMGRYAVKIESRV